MNSRSIRSELPIYEIVTDQGDLDDLQLTLNSLAEDGYRICAVLPGGTGGLERAVIMERVDAAVTDQGREAVAEHPTLVPVADLPF